MMKFVIPKIRDGLDARAAAIQSDKEAAEGSKAEAAKLQKEYEQKLAEAKTEANRINEEARAVGRGGPQGSDRQGRERGRRRSWPALPSRSKPSGIGRCRSSVRRSAEISVDLAEKVVGRSLDRTAQAQLIDDYIAEVGAMNGGSQN